MTTNNQPNIPQRMHQIAARLGELYRLKAGAEIEQEAQQAEYDARLHGIVAPEAWASGKTVDDKKMAVKAAEFKDEILAQMRANTSEHAARLADYAAETAALEAERRALEWTVRVDMAKVIGGRQGASDNGAHEDHGAPDAALEGAEWDEYTFKLADENEVPWAECAAQMQAGAPKLQADAAYMSELEF